MEITVDHYKKTVERMQLKSWKVYCKRTHKRKTVKQKTNNNKNTDMLEYLELCCRKQFWTDWIARMRSVG